MLSLLLLTLFPFQEPAPAAQAELEGFRYEPGRLKVGRVYHYKKSNVDGTRESNDDLYVASETRLESFKWHPGDSSATLVVAELDWETFSVTRFQNFRVLGDGTRTLRAELSTSEDGKSLLGEAGGQSFRAPIEVLPWHSYDFDLASLNVSMRFLVEPEGKVSFGIMDATGGAFRHKGKVELSYTGDEVREGVPCRRYKIDGPGLEDRGGQIWVRLTDDPVFVDYEIDLPDEPGMKSGKLRLAGSDDLTIEAWPGYVRSKLGGPR